MKQGRSLTGIGSTMLFLACLTACTTNGYEGSGRRDSELATLCLLPAGRLNIIAVDDLKKNSNDAASDKFQILAGRWTLQLKYWTQVDNFVYVERVHSLLFKARCDFEPKHSYIVSIEGNRLAIVDVGETALPTQPLLIGGREYVQALEQRKATGVPLACERPDS